MHGDGSGGGEEEGEENFHGEEMVAGSADFARLRLEFGGCATGASASPRLSGDAFETHHCSFSVALRFAFK
jgi:hypothetical protein